MKIFKFSKQKKHYLLLNYCFKQINFLVYLSDNVYDLNEKVYDKNLK